ncbi:MAG: VIT domain-containing protein [Candidatus Eremiobacteraeota bacterium]|nr:VIT domain-containing protein [Candidatus Eremiobacteraeota bacterium]
MAGTTKTELPLLELKGEPLKRALGMLTLSTPGGKVALPLASVDITACVTERIAEVTVTEVFRNTFTEHLEAVYIFPLAGGAAVTSFEMKVKDRVIKGVVKEREEARRDYQKALSDGKRAALLEKERDDVFTVQVGNVPPGEEISVKITYCEGLPYFEDGSTEIRLPLVVAPRYIPGAPLERDQVGRGVEDDTDVVPDASRITPPRLVPGMDPAVRLGIRVEFLPSSHKGEQGFADLVCSQHATRTSNDNGTITVELARESERLNRDFVLRWRLAGEKVTTRFITALSAQGERYGMISLVPPLREGFRGLARDVVFILDRSGSMEGIKMASAARACALLLATLEPRDRFAILAFDDKVEWMEQSAEGKVHCFVHADEDGQEKGNRFLRGIDSRGGTEIDRAVNDALSKISSRQESAALPLIVLLTDGQIGDESRVLKTIQKSLGSTRIFTVGIDTAVNEGFLKRLAGLGGGTAAFVAPGESLEKALRTIGREIGAPIVTDISIADEGAQADRASLAPFPVADLFAGKATCVYFTHKAVGALKVKGRHIDGSSFEETITPEELPLHALSSLWARSRIADLEDRFRIEPQRQQEIKREIIAISTGHSILSRFTAFIVVDESEIVNKDGSRRTVVQPVEMPDQWDMKLKQQSAPRGAGAPAPGFMASLSAAMPMITAAECFSPAMDECFEGAIAAEGMPGPMKSISRMAKTIGDIAAKGKSTSPVRNELVPKPEPMEKKPQMQRQKAPSIPFGQALEEYRKSVEEALQKLKKGQLPDGELMEKPRKALLEILGDYERAHELPELMKFLRTEAVELVASLSVPGVKPQSLAALFEKHYKALELILKNIGAKGTAPPDAAGAFWEETI